MRDRRPTPGSIRTLIAPMVATAALLAPACGGLGVAVPSVAVPAPSVTTGSTGSAPGATGATGSGSPTASPAAGTVTQGTASLNLSGGVNMTVSFNRLSAPAGWTPPPGAVALSWGASGNQLLSLAGPSFTSQITTDAAHTLSFTVNVDGAPVTFRSASGECTVTISPALPDRMGGTFFCTNLPGSGGTPIVNAQGSFSATE